VILIDFLVLWGSPHRFDKLRNLNLPNLTIIFKLLIDVCHEIFYSINFILINLFYKYFLLIDYFFEIFFSINFISIN